MQGKKVKTSALINDGKMIIAYWEESGRNEAFGERV